MSVCDTQYSSVFLFFFFLSLALDDYLELSSLQHNLATTE